MVVAKKVSSRSSWRIVKSTFVNFEGDNFHFHAVMRSIFNERKKYQDFLLRPLFTFLKRLKSTVLREFVECISRFCRKFSKEIFFYLLHRQAKVCRSPDIFSLLSLKGVLQNCLETGRHINKLLQVLATYHFAILVQKAKNYCFIQKKMRNLSPRTSANRVISLPHTRCILYSLCLPVPHFSQLSVNLTSFLRISENIFQI